MNGRIRIVVADGYELVVEGLRRLLDSEPDMLVVATATDGEQLVREIRRHAPDVVVLGLDLRGRAGIASLERIRAERLPVRVLALSTASDVASMRAALEAGADGYALKSEPSQHAFLAVRQVHRGQLIFPAGARRWLVRGRPRSEPLEVTDRELTVLSLVADGLSNGRIARRLQVSENTVKFHLRNSFRKLGTRNRTEAARWYLREHATYA